MITRVLRSGRPGVLFKFALLAAGAMVFGPGSATAQSKAKEETVIYSFKFTFTKGSPCTITQEDVVFKNNGGPSAIPRYCKDDKKCGRVRVQKGDFKGDSISFESDPPGQTFEVVFDPFVHKPVRPIPGNQKMTLRKMKGVTGSKTYWFSVVAKDCNTLDPTIVIDH
jgi:hypothetical protein